MISEYWYDPRDPSWQPLPPLPVQPGYPRPRGATPADIALALVRRTSRAGSRARGPLSFGSCSSPHQVSPSLTFGTPDANGLAASAVGRVRLAVQPGDPLTAADEADVSIGVRLTDVRCAVPLAGYCEGGALSDYTGSLQMAATSVRLTDTASGGTAADPATLQDWLQLSLPVGCVPTAQAGTGSVCSTDTSLDAIFGQAVVENRRAVWELGQIAVRDNGIDDPQVEAYTTLAVQGLFVP